MTILSPVKCGKLFIPPQCGFYGDQVNYCTKSILSANWTSMESWYPWNGITWYPYNSVTYNHRFNVLRSLKHSYFLSWEGIIFSRDEIYIILLVGEECLLGIWRIEYSWETVLMKKFSFGYQQFKVLLLMKCGASETHTVVLGRWNFLFPNALNFHTILYYFFKTFLPCWSSLLLCFCPLKAGFL